MNVIFHQEYIVKRDDYTGAGKASSEIKRALKEIGIEAKILRNIAVASYEAEINMVIHAYGGIIKMDVYENGDIHLLFADDGPGIKDIEKAMVPGFSTASEKARSLGFGAGMGLPNIKRVSDEFTIESSEEGTRIHLVFHTGV
ncbi:MAG: ATP-binding protein [Solobacterium sp.]|nr:ATP-binding protein [Solobacterium sp.]